LVYLQTALCYGRPDSVPIAVDHPLRPFTSYGISKTAGEQYLALSDLSRVSLRLANVTGPRLAIGPIPAFYKRLKAGQACFCTRSVRDFLDMEDFFSIIDRVLAEDCPSGVFNVSTGEGHSIKEIFERVADHLAMKLDHPVEESPPGDDDVPEVVLDPSETERVLGWRAKTSFSETIRRMLDWYDRYGVTDVYSHLKAPANRAPRSTVT
jgi:UDP-glucose 4-epimerase